MASLFLDISTGEFLTAEGDRDDIDKLLANFSPKELLIERGNKKSWKRLSAATGFCRSWRTGSLPTTLHGTGSSLTSRQQA